MGFFSTGCCDSGSGLYGLFLSAAELQLLVRIKLQCISFKHSRRLMLLPSELRYIFILTTFGPTEKWLRVSHQDVYFCLCGGVFPSFDPRQLKIKQLWVTTSHRAWKVFLWKKIRSIWCETETLNSSLNHLTNPQIYFSSLIIKFMRLIQRFELIFKSINSKHYRWIFLYCFVLHLRPYTSH